MSSLAGDVDYTRHGATYTTHRRTDPRIAALVHAALGDARTVLNVGAGAGSYEPLDRHVIAIEPSPAMRARRPPHLAPAIHAVAESLPLDDRSVDASMATVTIHQWQDTAAGLRELRRVTRGPVVVLTFDPDALKTLWLAEYVPELDDAERRRYPPISRVVEWLGGDVDVRPVPVPIDCVDGFTEAFYARPHAFLDPAVRGAQSAWTFVPPEVAARRLAKLAADLEDGTWEARFGHLRAQPTFTGALRLVVAR